MRVRLFPSPAAHPPLVDVAKQPDAWETFALLHDTIGFISPPARGVFDGPVTQDAAVTEHSPKDGPAKLSQVRASQQTPVDETYTHKHKDGSDPPSQIKASQAALVDETPLTNYITIYNMVANTAQFNYLQARIPIPSGLHIPAWRKYLSGYHDQDLLEYLQFGWPCGYDLPWMPYTTGTNHFSAWAYPQHVEKYIDTELKHRALLGPWAIAPFSGGLHTSPLMSRPKKDSTDRRIIVDLSWPTGASVNHGIPTDTYLRVPYKLKLPTVDQLADLIVSNGPGSHVYVVDISRAYRNLRLDPLSWPLMGIEWNNALYCDISVPFGLRTGAFFCQRTTNAVAHIMNNHKYKVLPYIDDFAGAAPKDSSGAAFDRLKQLLQELGLPIAESKLQPPSCCATWLGITFDSDKMEMYIPLGKVDEIIRLLRQWKSKQSCSYHQLQVLLGKLHYVSRCCRPARLFIGRMLSTLREYYHTRGVISLSDQFKRDIAWWLDFLPAYNGKSLLTHPPTPPDFHLELDACLTGCGGICEGYYYHCEFPNFILQEVHHIAHLEMLNIVIAAKLFRRQWHGHTVQVICDNAAAVSVLESGRARDPYLLACARELWYICATCDIILQPRHAAGITLQTADSLSRFHLREKFRSACAYLKPEKRLEVDARLFKLCANY